MNTLAPLFNRDGNLPEDSWFQLVPRGEWPTPPAAKAKRMQVIDDAALDAMVNSFKPKILIDQEHFSYDGDKSSEAFGWITEVQKRQDGLWGKVEWTDLGNTAITNKRYRFVSPVWLPRDLQNLGGDKVRPTRLDSVGLTNQPNLRGMVPLSNRDGAPVPADSNNKNNNASMKLLQLAALLGLAAEASEDSILTAVTALKNRAEGAETKLTALEQETGELRNRVSAQDDEQIEAEFDAREVEDGKRARLRPVLKAMKNREERIGFLNEVIGEPGEEETPATTTASGKPVLNRNAAKTPKPARGKGAETEEDVKARADKAEAAVQEYKIANRCSYSEAHDVVMRQKPELFGLAKN